MNNVLSIEEFFSFIEKSSSLRLKLLSDLNTITNNDSLDQSIRFHHIRSNIPTLYSQYEGFTKDIFNTIPLFLSSIDKSINLDNVYLSLHIACSLFYKKESSFYNYISAINTSLNSFFEESTTYFSDYNPGTIVVPHNDKLYVFFELFNFNTEIINKFKLINTKIKTYYKRRNSIIHGSITESNSSEFYLIEEFDSTHLIKSLMLWNEQYEFTKDIINLLRESTFSWAQENFLTNQL